MKPAAPPPDLCGRCGQKPAVKILTSKSMLPVCCDCWERFLLGTWDEKPVTEEKRP